MDFNAPYLMDRTGCYFRLYDPVQGPIPKSAEPMSFVIEYDAWRFVSNLYVPHEFWEKLLHHYDPELRHISEKWGCQWAVARLLHSRRILFYRAPDPNKLRDAAARASFTNTARSRGRIVPDNSHGGRPRPLIRVKDYDEALAFVNELDPSAEQLEAINQLQPVPLPKYAGRKRVAWDLFDGVLIAREEPVNATAPPSGSSPSPAEPSRSNDRPPTLCPHEEGDGRAEPGPAPPDGPAESLEEYEQRLEAARERLKQEGYQPKHSDAQILAQARSGKLDDRFIVRFMESDYAVPEGHLGRKTGGEVKFWSTTFNQLENADTDPETICAVLGLDYDPTKDYTLAVVDTEGKGAGQAATIVPTHEELGKFAKTEVEGLDPEVVDQVMTPEYNKEYAKAFEEFSAEGFDVSEGDDLQEYADEYIATPEGKEKFKTRAKIQQKLGANQHYTGNGATRNLASKSKNQYGAMETFTYDKNPQTLGAMEKKGSVKIIPAQAL
jgi:hypothetical protein